MPRWRKRARSGHTGQRGRLRADIFSFRQPAQHVVHRLVAEGIEAIQQTLHGPADKSGSPTHGQAIGGSQVINTQVLDRNFIMQAGMDAEQHTRRVRGFSEETVYMVAESQLETKRNSAGPPPTPHGR